VPQPRAVLRLLRVSLAPSAASDVLAGACAALSQGGALRIGALLLGLAASLCVYHAGMALNDYADRAFDARTRPTRPIPSGSISPRFARGAGFLGLALSLLFAGLAGGETLGIDAAIVLLVLAYDFGGKGSAGSGPPILGACRALNFLLGASCAGVAPEGAALLLPAGAYFLYVFLVAHLARMEDTDVHPRRARVLALAAPAAFPLSSLGLPSPIAGGAIGIAGGLFLLLPLVSVRTWTRSEVERAVGRLLGGTILFGASVAFGAGLPAAGAGLLVLFAAARALARRFPPT